ncbi:MAG TPA: hypothetical protein VEA60_13240 [Allosphingosinicella sp.]|nr:hypothetical protein [Allosphingosinicella sp.]
MSPETPAKATSARDVLKRIYRIGMIAATITLAALACLAYASSTAGTGDVLLSIVLGGLAFFALLSIPRLDWRDDQADVYRGILDDMRTRFPFDVEFTTAGERPAGPASASAMNGRAGAGAPISVRFAETEVHRVDADRVGEARRMAAEGRTIDDICRLVDPGHDGHDASRQQALRRIVQAMLDQG